MTTLEPMTQTSPPPPSGAGAARLQLLYQIGRELNSPEPGAGLDLNTLLPRILSITAGHIDSPRGSVIVLDERDRLANAWVLTEGRLVAPNRVTMELVLDLGLAGWVKKNRLGAVVANTADDPRWLRRPIELPRTSGPGAALAWPLLLPDRVVGVLTYVHPEPGHFTEEDVALVSAVADQITVAIENARLFAAERRRRRVADTLQEIAASVGSSLDVGYVLDRILEQLARVVPYDHGEVLLLKGDRLDVVVSRPAEAPGPVGPPAMSLQVIREQRVIVLEDAPQHPGWGDQGGDARVRAWIGAPLYAQGEPIGAVSLGSYTPGLYTADEGRVAAACASHAAIAVSNARLYEEARKQVEYLSFLHDTSRHLTSSLDMREILQQLLQRVVTLLGVEAGSIGLIDDERGELVFEVAVGGGADAVQGVALKLGEGIAGWVALTGEAAVVQDVAQDSRWYSALDEQSGFRTRAIIAVPIEVKGRRLGVIEAINPAAGRFYPQHLTLVGSLAGLAGSAIANAQAFAAVQAAEERYAGLFADSIDPILITDIAGTITEANRKACDFLGYLRDEIIGVNINLVHRMGTGLLGERRLAHVQSGAELIFKTRAWTKPGREVPVEVHAKRIRRGEQEFVQWIEHDITERVQLEEMREDLLSMIFHDLRAPLGNVLSSLEMLEAALPRDESNAALGPLVDIALRSSQRLSHLLNSLLDLRRLEAGQAILTKEPVELSALVRESMEQVRPAAATRSVYLDVDVPARVPLLLLDVDMIRRVLINVLDNAVKYTGPGGRVRLSVEAPPREPVLVAVQDEGPGIAPEHHTMIFEKFARVRHENGPKGLGLGLAFCRLAVEAHGGKIWVESEVGQGATFKFTLPV